MTSSRVLLAELAIQQLCGHKPELAVKFKIETTVVRLAALGRRSPGWTDVIGQFGRRDLESAPLRTMATSKARLTDLKDHSFAPSNVVTLSASRSSPSTQRRFTATIRLPSCPTPEPWVAMPQFAQ